MNEPVSPLITILGLLVISGSVTAWVAIVLTLRGRREPIAFAPRQLVPWTGGDVFWLAATFLALEILAGGAARAWAGDEDSQAINAMIVLQSLARVGWFGLATFYLVRRRGATASDLGADLGHATSDLRNGIWLFLAAVVPVLLVQRFFTDVLEMPSKHPLLEQALGTPSPWFLVGATVAAVGIAPWFEEFVFRVVLQGWLESEQVRLRGINDPGASDRPGYAPVVIASLVFAGLHFAAGPDPVAIFVLSLFLGYAYRQTHRILPSLVIHTGINGWTMLNLWILYLTGEPS